MVSLINNFVESFSNALSPSSLKNWGNRLVDKFIGVLPISEVQPFISCYATLGEAFKEGAVKAGGRLIEVFTTDALKPVNRANMQGLTLLHEACLKGDVDEARKLMAQGADPYLKTFKGNSAFQLARKDLSMLKVLTRTENVPAFAECQTVHDFWAIVYPPSTTDLPADSGKLTKLIPYDPPLEQLDQAITPEEREKLPTIDDLAKALKEEEERQYEKDKQDGLPVPPRESYTLSLSQVVAYLRKIHPLFDQALKLAGEPTIKMCPTSAFQLADGSLVHGNGDSADYTATAHTIQIEEGGGYKEIVMGLVFETMNAMQRESFLKEVELSKAGDISREEYAFLSEWIEFHTYAGFQMFFHKEFPEISSVLANWQRVNISFGDGLTSHAQSYRQDWDTVRSCLHVVKNRDRFERRLAVLRASKESGAA